MNENRDAKRAVPFIEIICFNVAILTKNIMKQSMEMRRYIYQSK